MFRQLPRENASRMRQLHADLASMRTQHFCPDKDLLTFFQIHCVFHLS